MMMMTTQRKERRVQDNERKVREKTNFGENNPPNTLLEK
jgi:hypothetical protein